MSGLKIGDQIPDFTLQDQHSNNFTPRDLVGKKNLVIYFYPKDETKVCTAQACSFRDSYEEFTDLGCEVIGISDDSVKKHTEFAANHELPFVLLSDKGNKIRKLFGVPRDLMGILPGRYTYIADINGEIIHIFNDAFGAGSHIAEALAALKQSV